MRNFPNNIRNPSTMIVLYNYHRCRRKSMNNPVRTLELQHIARKHTAGKMKNENVNFAREREREEWRIPQQHKRSVRSDKQKIFSNFRLLFHFRILFEDKMCFSCEEKSSRRLHWHIWSTLNTKIQVCSLKRLKWNQKAYGGRKSLPSLFFRFSSSPSSSFSRLPFLLSLSSAVWMLNFPSRYSIAPAASICSILWVPGGVETLCRWRRRREAY